MKEDKYDSLEQLLGERLGEFREEPSEGLFERIEATLSALEAAPVVTAEQKAKRTVSLWQRPLVRLAVATLAAASLFFGVVMVVDTSLPDEQLQLSAATTPEAEAQNSESAAILHTEDSVATNEDEESAAEPQLPIAPRSQVTVAAIPQQVARLTTEQSGSEPTTTTTNKATDKSSEQSQELQSQELQSQERSAKTTTRERADNNVAPHRQSATQNQQKDEDIEAYWRTVLGVDEAPRRLGISHPTEISLYAANVGFNQGDMILNNLASGQMVINEQSAMQNEVGYVAPTFMTPKRGTQLKHLMPVSVGVTASYALSDWLALETGLIYTHLYSRSDSQGTMNDYTTKRDMHYLGIPIGATVRFANLNRVNFYGRLGTTLEHCVSAKDTEFMDGAPDVSRKLDTPGLQFSLDASAGANYLLWGGISAYAEAGMTYWQSTAYHPANYRTENPVSLTCRVGVRFTFM